TNPTCTATSRPSPGPRPRPSPPRPGSRSTPSPGRPPTTHPAHNPSQPGPGTGTRRAGHHSGTFLQDTPPAPPLASCACAQVPHLASRPRRPAGGNRRPIMTSVLSYAPLAAAAFGAPRFLPQVLKLPATHHAAGISWSWAALTSVNNAAWTGYFALFRYWTA